MIDLDEKRLLSLQISLLQIRNQQVQNRKYIRQILTKHQMKNNKDKASLINYLVKSTQKTEDTLNNILHWIQGELDMIAMLEVDEDIRQGKVKKWEPLEGMKKQEEFNALVEETREILTKKLEELDQETVQIDECVFDSKYSEWCTTHKTFKHADTTTQRDLDFEDRRLGIINKSDRSVKR